MAQISFRYVHRPFAKKVADSGQKRRKKRLRRFYKRFYKGRFYKAASYGGCIDILAPGDVAPMNGLCRWRPSMAARAAALVTGGIVQFGSVTELLESCCYGLVGELPVGTNNCLLELR